MSTSFSNQVLAQIFLAAKNKPSTGIYDLPRKLDEEVAKIHLKHLDADLTKLTKSQARYIELKLKGHLRKMNIGIDYLEPILKIITTNVLKIFKSISKPNLST